MGAQINQRWPIHTQSLFYAPSSLRPICFYAPCKYTQLRNLRPHTLVLTLFSWLRCMTLTLAYSVISYGNIIFYLCLFDWRPLIQGHSWGVTQVLGVVSKPNPIDTVIYLCKITFNIILSFMSSSLEWSFLFRFFHISHLPFPVLLDNCLWSERTRNIFLCVSEQQNSGQGRLVVEVAWSYTHTHTRTHLVGLLWTGDQLFSADL